MLDLLSFPFFKIFLRKSIAFSLLFFVIILRFSFLHSQNFTLLMDAIIFNILFSWSLIKPQDLGLFICFALGVFYDLLSSHLLGMMASVFITYRFLAGWKHVRYVKASFFDIWQFFGFISMLLLIFTFSVEFLTYYHMPKLMTYLSKLLYTIILFPLCFFLIQKMLLFLYPKEL